MSLLFWNQHGMVDDFSKVEKITGYICFFPDLKQKHTLIGIAAETLTEKWRVNKQRVTVLYDEIRETRMIEFHLTQIVNWLLITARVLV